MHVLITGGTGTIGRRLIDHLLEHGHQVSVLSTRPIKPPFLPAEVGFLQWDGQTARGWGDHLEKFEAVVHLAGAGIADRRWTEERKKVLLNSRLESGRAVLEAISFASNNPRVLIQASGIDYYGPCGDQLVTETQPPGDGFLSEICVQWEAVTAPVETMGVRRAVIRTGIVLDPAGGALPQLTLPFKLFAGGPLGSGEQWFPWIHWYDEVAAIRFLIEQERASGPFNLTAPQPLPNREFAKVMGQVMNRPAFLPAPSLALKLMLGEMATPLLLQGQRAIPERLQQLGFQFKFQTAEAALRSLLG